MNLPLLVLVALAGLLVAFSFAARAEEEVDGLAVGVVVPPFRLNDHEGRAVSLGGGKGHGWFVLAFYPKALTPGCIKEVCSLRDSLGDLKALGVQVYGISLDDVVSQKKFVETHALTFPLLSDPDAKTRAYWLGALLREANTRDVWLFTDVETIRRSWALILPFLGKSRAMWAWLLGESAVWPPPEAARSASR